jgi:hypothetical protein
MALLYAYFYERTYIEDGTTIVEEVVMYDSDREAADQQYFENFGTKPTRFLRRERW